MSKTVKVDAEEYKRLLALQKDHEKNNPTKPVILPDDKIDYGAIKRIANDYIEEIEKDGRPEKVKEYFFEVVMIAVYGKDVFNYINNKLK